jgi:hypothetical protein
MANASVPSKSQTEDPSFIELVLRYLPGELRRSVEEVADAVTPETIARNDILLRQRGTQLGQLREYIIGLFTSAVDAAIDEAVEKATTASTSSTSGAPSRSVSSFIANSGYGGTAVAASRQASAASAASATSAASGSTPYSPRGFLNGGTRRRRKRYSRSHKKRN